MQNPALEPVSTSEARQVVLKTEIKGRRNGQPLVSNADLLHSALIPKFKIKIRGLPDLTFWLTQLYRLRPGSSHYNITGFAGEDESSTVMRSFYLSGSQGVWRGVPFILHDDRGGDDSLHYGKGYSHLSTNAVAELQQAFAQISLRQNSVRPVKGAEEVFYGAVPWFHTDELVYDKLDDNRRLRFNERHLIDCDYVRFTSPRAQWLDGNLHPYDFDVDRLQPENIFIAGYQAPDWERRAGRWTQRSPIYKKVGTDAFESADCKFLYLFNTDAEDKTWIGATLYSNAEITTMGTSSYWINDGNLSTARFEHPYYYSATDEKKDALSGYGSMRTRRHGYADMYPKYLSRMQSIRQYRELPDRVRV